MSYTLLKDTSWIRSSFLSIPESVDDIDRYRRSGGWLKFMDTTLGGNTAINAPYQFCRYADIKERRLLPDVGKGMGRYYSKHIDDWGHNVHFRMGVPAFTGVIPFAMKAVNGPAARYVATGRVPGYFSTVGRIAGYIISAAFWEITLLTAFISTMIDLTHSRFYYLKPTMWQYWRTVQTMLNTLSANLGISIPSKATGVTNTADGAMTMADGASIEHARTALPDIFGGNGLPGGSDLGVDVHAVASRAQALQIRHQEEMYELVSNFSANTTPDEIASMIEQRIRGGTINGGNNRGNLRPKLTNATLSAYESSFNFGPYEENVDEETRSADLKESISAIAKKAGDEAGKNENGLSEWFKETVDSFTPLTKQDNPYRAPLADKLLAELRDGSQWCSFRVDSAADSVGESFSNQSQQSDIGNLFNNLSQTIRNATFNLGGGKTGIPLIDGAVSTVAGGLADMFVDGTATTFQFLNPVIGLMYGAQIEIPKRWSSSSTSLPSTTFDITLMAGYGNVLSYYQDVLFPLCMLLSMALPRGTGSQSYGAPFYVQYYSKGRSQVRIGLVSSLSVTRGVGNAPWHKRGWPMGVKVSMTIEDMSEVMFSPVAQGIMIQGPGASVLGSPIDENAMGDYLAVLSALGMNEQEYFLPRIRRRFNSLINNFNSWLSPQRWMALGTDTAVGSMLATIFNQTSVRN